MGERDNSRVIMVVDDQESNREVLRMFLIWDGYVVIEASNGLEAVNLVACDCPDLIVMDLAMPVMDGFAAVRRLREVPESRDVPIIAYTAYDTPNHRAEAIRTGFDEFLTKPINFTNLSFMLDRYLPGTRRVTGTTSFGSGATSDF